MIRLIPVVLNDKKTAFIVMNFIKLSQFHNFTKMGMKIWHTCNLCVIWQHYPGDMYIHLHTIGLTGVTELGTVTVNFAPNRRRFHWSISRWILMRRKNIFDESLKSSLSLFVPSFRFFQHLTRQHSTQSVRNMPPPSPRHLLPHVLQIMPRNANYDQFQPKGHHNEENPQSMTKMPGNPKFYLFH